VEGSSVFNMLKKKRFTGMQAYFPYDADAVAFNSAFTRALTEIQKQIVAKYLPPENTQRFRHGGGWRTPGNAEALGGQMQTHSAFLETRFDDIVNNDLAVIERSFNHLGEAMHRQFAQMLYSTVGEACNQSGNTIDARAEGSLEGPSSRCWRRSSWGSIRMAP
jgi:hypothetical protein